MLRSSACIFATLLCTAFLACRAAAQDGTPIVVNEILYDQTDTRTEFFELLNRSDEAVDLQTFAFSDDRQNPKPIIDERRLLAPGAFIVLVDDEEQFAARFPDVDLIAPPRWDGLNNGGDGVLLYRNDIVIERVDYKPSWGGDDGISLERIDPFGPADQAANFGSSTAPAGATPGAPNSLFAPDTAPPALLFAEEQTPTVLRVFFDEPLRASTVTAAAFELMDGRRPQATSPRAGGAEVDLTFDTPLAGTSLSVTGLSDRAGNAIDRASLRIAYQPKPGAVAINEIMFDPLADDFDNRPNQPEYVELLNTGSRPLTLRSAYWTDRPDEDGAADTLRLGNRFVALSPNGFAVAFAQPDDVTSPAEQSTLAQAFPNTDFSADGVALLPVPRRSLGLLNAGALIRLHSTSGDTLGTVQYTPDWHAEGLVETKGVALERISPQTPAQDAQSWTSSVAPAGGTPGYPNSVFVTAPPPGLPSRLVAAPSPFSPDGDGLDDATRLQYSLQADASLVRVRIYDARGRQVYEDEGRLAGRNGALIWDGRGTDGRTLRLGIYVILLEAVDAEGGRVETLRETVVLARPLNE